MGLQMAGMVQTIWPPLQSSFVSWRHVKNDTNNFKTITVQTVYEGFFNSGHVGSQFSFGPLIIASNELIWAQICLNPNIVFPLLRHDSPVTDDPCSLSFSMCNEFSQIFQLCQFVMVRHQTVSKICL